MNRKRKVAITSPVVVLAILFLAPVIPAKVASRESFSLTVLHVPSGANSSGWGELTDPSGSYWFYDLNNTTCQETTCYDTTAMNLTSFKQLQSDPYSTHLMGPGCTSKIQGSVILVTCPQARCAPNHFNGEMSCMPITPTPTTNGLDSIAYWLVHHGATYFGGRYLLG